MKMFNNPKYVSKSPLVSSVMFEAATIGQIWRMTHEHTSAGQNPWAWFAIIIGLGLFVNFYRVCCPTQKFALWCAALSALLTTVGLGVVLYYK